MFSIGEFARLGTVSVRTLRHYDEIGLLRPARVDPETGYRGYSASPRPLIQGVILWIVVAVLSLLAIRAGWIAL